MLTLLITSALASTDAPAAFALDGLYAASTAPALDLALVPVGDPLQLSLVTPGEPVSWPTRDGGSSSGGSSSGSSSGNNNGGNASNETPSKLFKVQKIGKWKYQFYVLPGAGAQINGSTSAVSAGADVGMKYWRKEWKGDAAVGASILTGTGVNGYDVHLGNTFGRREKYWGITAGLDGFYNAVTYDDPGYTDLAPSLGLGIPVELTVGPKKYYLQGGIEPAFLSDRSRWVRWDAPAYDGAFGFGNEFTGHVAAGLNIEGITGEIGFAQTVTAAGIINTPTLTLAL